MAYITRIDQIISQIPLNDDNVPRVRILYFYGEDRHVIRRVLSDGNRLWELITELPGWADMPDPSDSDDDHTEPDAEDRMVYLTGSGAMMDAAEYFAARNKPAATPVCLYLTDFHIYANKETKDIKKSAAEYVKAFLDDPKLVDSILLMSSPFKQIPRGFESCIHLIDVPKIDNEDIANLILATQKQNKITDTQREAVFDAANQYRGLSRDQVETILSKLEAEFGFACEVFADKDAKDDCSRRTSALIQDAKREMSSKQHALVFVDTSDSVKAVGMNAYESWLGKVRKAFIAGNPNAPRGVVLIGVPGTGKSLMAKRTAQEFKCPLIRFDLGMCKSKDFGKSNENLREYLKQFEDIAPLVVLIDEAERHLSAGEHTHEVTEELIGILLEWMQDKEKSVFMFFTSNDITLIPPQLLRMDRIDKIYFSGMPWGEDLARILQANLIQKDREWRKSAQCGFLAGDLIGRLKKCEDDDTADSYCTDMIEALAAAAQKEPRRDLLFTGADLSQLIKDASLELEQEKSMPFDANEFKTAMLAQVNDSFRPTGESNMAGIVHLYQLSAAKNYSSASSYQELEAIAKDPSLTELPKKDFVLKYDRVLYERVGKRLIAAKQSPRK